MSGKRSRRKGATGEREVANILRDRFGIDTHRGLQTAGANLCDVEGTRYWIEVKRGKRCRVRAGYAQAVGDSTPDGRPPVLVWRDDHGQWMVTASLDDVMTEIDTWAAFAAEEVTRCKTESE